MVGIKLVEYLILFIFEFSKLYKGYETSMLSGNDEYLFCSSGIRI
jgi:hypothetical protein